MNTKENFQARLEQLTKEYKSILLRENEKMEEAYNGIYYRYKYPILTPAQTPVFWRYDLNYESNPYLMERFGINAVFNAGAIKFNGKYCVVARVEGNDRKSFFAIAESEDGINHFKFRDYPILLPETDEPDTNVYDMRLVRHEDGWIYGLFCTERKDPDAGPHNTSSAVANCGIVRTKDLKNWERLPDLISFSGQQRNVVLHPEFIKGKYALYTRPQDGFIDTGSGGGIGFGYTDDMTNPIVHNEEIIDNKTYHTIKEVKNGQGPAPVKTEKGWLHLAHGVRNTAAGLRYVLYMFMTDLKEPHRVTYLPAGHFMAPQGDERVGDVSNVLFANGWIADEDGKVFIYYASSDTRLHVATTTVDQLLDYCMNTAPDGLRSRTSVETLHQIISKNQL